MYTPEQLAVIFEKWHKRRIASINLNAMNQTEIKMSLGGDTRRIIPMLYTNPSVNQSNRFR